MSDFEEKLPCKVGETVYKIRNGQVEQISFDSETEIKRVSTLFGKRFFNDEKDALRMLANRKKINNEGETNMGLLERGYKAAAVADLERSLRELEERNRNAELKPENVKELESNLNFAERINIITTAQAEEFRRRMAIITERQERRQNEDIVDSLENPRERAERFQSMDRYNAKIAQDRNDRSERAAASSLSHTKSKSEQNR